MPLTDKYATKIPLTFKKDGTFRILMMSDLHHKPNTGKATVRAMRCLIDETKPDFVLLAGDNTTGKATNEEFLPLLADIASPMEEANIPWAHVFGNHDKSTDVSKEFQQAEYEKCPHCVSKAGPAELPGVGNYFLPVLDERGECVFGVWCLDSHQDFLTPDTPAFMEGESVWEILLPDRLHGRSDDDFIRFEQIMWYWNTSVELEKLCGHKIPSLMALHIPLFEFYAITRNAGRTGMRGEFGEKICCSEINSGLFAACLQRGDVKAIFAGHDHNNTLDGIYCGIRMGFDGSIGAAAYGTSDHDPRGGKHRLRGGRIFDISASNPADIKTEMVYVDERIYED